MRKINELTDYKSCLNRATESEMIFVLLARDYIAAPHAIREWCKKRIEIGKNQPGDAQIVEALQCAAAMEREKGNP